MRVAIIGGGIIGLGIADALLRETRVRDSLELTIFDAHEPGGASAKAAGILGAQFESHESSPFVTDLVEARASFERWLVDFGGPSALERVDYRKAGVLRLATSARRAEELRAIVEWQSASGLRAAYVSPWELEKIEPALASFAHGAAHFPDDAQVEPRLLLALLETSLRERGAMFVDSRVLAVESAPSAATIRVEVGASPRESRPAESATHSADFVVVANGAWASRLTLTAGKTALPLDAPPVRGQMIRLATARRHFGPVIEVDGTYALQRAQGPIDVGATVENVGFDAGTTADAAAALLRTVTRMIPEIDGAPIAEQWAGLRPLAPSPRVELVDSRVLVAVGHYRNGILLAPTTARKAAAIVARL